MLSRIAREFAAEIANHDWSDAPWRLDRAGHRREIDTNRGLQVLTAEEADHVRTNVMWVVAQVLLHSDPNLDLHEFAGACGVPRRITHNSDGRPSGGIPAGIRTDHESGAAVAPGQPF
ncbi:MAG: hypothetical protein M3130_01095 [Actinomycetota bacterium]|nr:hypothetical protein [Actinomycetota bacterium]